jgi:uncharacterized protein YjlB
MRLGLYAPRSDDSQTPHRQDELYVVASGSGEFVSAGQRTSFEAGDVLFAPAGVEHRFEHFSNDFATWVVFYGPQGGEQVPAGPREHAGAKPARRVRSKSSRRDSGDEIRSIRIVHDPAAA